MLRKNDLEGEESTIIRRLTWATLRPALASITCLLLTAATIYAQEPQPDTSDAAEAPAEAPAPGSSEAEQILGLQQLLESDRKRLKSLQATERQVAREFDAVSAEFTQLDAKWAEVAPDTESPDGESEPPEPSSRTAVLKQQRDEVRERFDLIIERRKLIARQIVTLKKKIALEREALEGLESDDSAVAEEQTDPEGDSTSAAPPPEESSRENPSLAKALGIPVPQAPEGVGAGDGGPIAAATTDPAYDPYVAEAVRRLEELEGEQRLLSRRADIVDRAIELFGKDLTNVRELLRLAKEQQALEARMPSTDGPAGDADADGGAEAENDDAYGLERRAAVAAEITGHLAVLKASREEIVARISDVENEIDAARQRLQYLQSPFAVHRMKRWLLREGPRVLFILAVMFVMWGTARVVIGRITWALASRRGNSGADQRERAETLKRVSRNVASIVIVAVGGVAILQQFGVDLTVLLGGAAVVGMAIAFGAQNLVRDYFYGFLILVENQYRVGNVVRIGGVAGVVEDITLRITTLRDLEGVAHFIPHSQITTVSNLTHGWSRAVLEIPMPYKEDADRVMRLLMDVVETMQQDEQFGQLILGEPEMLGVDNFADSAVTIKLMVKTLPHKQWRVKRELLRRIKQAFDEHDVEIPFPQRTLHLRSDEAALLRADFARQDGQ